MKYEIIRTETADLGIRNIILHIAENWGADVARQALDQLEKSINHLGTFPNHGVAPRYRALKLQGYKVLISEKTLVFYKIDETNKKVIIFAVVDSRQDYLDIIRGL